jgi:FdhD protein
VNEHTGSKKHVVDVWSGQSVERKEDFIAEEVPIALVYNDVSHVVMMATPTKLDAFALGFSLSEGIVKASEEVYDIQIQHLDDGIEVALTISNQRFSELKERRRSLSGRTGCGICGAESLEQVRLIADPVTSRCEPNSEVINKAVTTLESRQDLQAATGAVHGAAWCNMDGELIEVCEDVGRHNALDKLIGVLAQKGLLEIENLNSGFVLVSSRVSYEMVQKTAMINASVLVAVSAATTMAIDVARQVGVRLIGFARENRHVIYVSSK